MDFEAELFRIAPWTMKVMQTAKTLNNGAILRGRTGWITRGIENPESIFEHVCKIALAAHYLIGTNDAIAEGVSHDFAEIGIPDYMPGEISKEDKRRKELSTWIYLTNKLPSGGFWFERALAFEGNQPLLDLDRICPCIQVKEYERRYRDNGLDEFYPYARKKIQTPELIKVLDEMHGIEMPNNTNPYEIYFDKLRRLVL